MKWATRIALLSALWGSGIMGCLDPNDDFTGDSTSWEEESSASTAVDGNSFRNDADPPMDPEYFHMDND